MHMDHNATPPWPIAIARAKGAAHLSLKKSCQDFGAWTYIATPSALIVAVADGAGSADHAEEGAYLSVQKTLLFFKKIFKTEGIPQSESIFKHHAQTLIFDIQHLLKTKAKIKKQSLGAFSTTLLVFIATPQGYFFFQIGDGFGVIRRPNCTRYELLLTPQKGEHINETRFITSEHAAHELAFCFGDVLPDFLAISTDGIESVALKNPSFIPYSPFFEPLEAFIKSDLSPYEHSQKLATFLSSPRFDTRSSDDRTLFLASFQRNLKELP